MSFGQLVMAPPHTSKEQPGDPVQSRRHWAESWQSMLPPPQSLESVQSMKQVEVLRQEILQSALPVQSREQSALPEQLGWQKPEESTQSKLQVVSSPHRGLQLFTELQSKLQAQPATAQIGEPAEVRVSEQVPVGQVAHAPPQSAGQAV